MSSRGCSKVIDLAGANPRRGSDCSERHIGIAGHDSRASIVRTLVAVDASFSHPGLPIANQLNCPILSAAQPALARGSQRAMADMQAAVPTLAQKFQQDATKGDGNAMVEDMDQLKREEQNGPVPNTFSGQDAQTLGGEVGDLGKGKVNSTEEQNFTQAFRMDVLYRGSSSASKTWDKIVNAAGGFMQPAARPERRVTS
jgi:hypothetical protein